MFTWARERRHHSVEDAARRVGTSPEAVRAWESGEAKPTVRQARALANFYARSFLEFFRDEPPELTGSSLVPDYRLHRGAPEPAESRDLLDIQSWAETARLNLIDLHEIMGEQVPTLPSGVRAKLSENPEAAAARAREAVGFRHQEQIGLAKSARDLLPKIFRNKLEGAGILVLKAAALAKFEARGLCIFADPLPVIVFSSEANSAQLFTMAHEFGHVALGESAISGPPPAKGSQSPGRIVEQWCNSFAAALLVPAADLAQLRIMPSRPAPRIGDDELAALAHRYGVSRHAMLLRLVDLRYVVASFYWDEKRAEFFEEEAQFKGGGRSKYYGSRFRSSLGDRYTGTVLEAWGAGRITNHNAAEFMGTKSIRHIEDIRDNYGTG
jgi:Zn-dependent peptidase ImmA (M78 family)/DNA-binding XRE family transcriptional regulator